MNKFRLLLLAFLPLALFAQTGYELNNRGGEIYTQKGALLVVQGNFINGNSTGSGHVINDGIIEVQGNFKNDSASVFTYSDTTSKDRVVKFTGTGTQAIQGIMNASGIASFYNLVVDKGSSSDMVEMQTPVTVDGSLVFGTATSTSTYTPSTTYTATHNNGLIKTFTDSAEYVLTIQNGKTDAIAGYPSLMINGAPTTAYVLTSGKRGSANGGLQRNIATATSYDFPIGTVGHGFNSVRMNFTQIPATGGLIMGKFSDSTDNANGFVGTIVQECFGCTAQNPAPDNNGYNRYFSSNPCNDNKPQWITIQNGVKDHGYWSFASSGNDTAYHYNVEAFPNSFLPLGNISLDALRTLKYSAAYGANPSDSTVNWGTAIDSVSNLNDLLSYSLNTGSCYSGTGVPGGTYTGINAHFSLKMGNTGTALPVTMMYVKAEPVNNKAIDVKWATELEVNNNGFQIMRSVDAISFINIGWVDGHNNSVAEKDYAFMDNNVVGNTVYYYKLKQVDNNGNSTESQIVSAMITGSATASIVIGDPIPNPTISASHIVVNANISQEMKVKIVNMVGQVISEQIVGLTAGNNNVNLDLQNVADGNYSAVLSMGEISVSKMVVVSR